MSVVYPVFHQGGKVPYPLFFALFVLSSNFWIFLEKKHDFVTGGCKIPVHWTLHVFFWNTLCFHVWCELGRLCCQYYMRMSVVYPVFSQWSKYPTLPSSSFLSFLFLPSFSLSSLLTITFLSFPSLFCWSGSEPVVVVVQGGTKSKSTEIARCMTVDGQTSFWDI